MEVTEHVEEAACDALNQIFFHYIRTGQPYVAMKYAMTMDGKIAAYTGKSQWVTGTKAREHVQRLRQQYSGIMVGMGTVLADDPSLTCRIRGGKNPVRIICDSMLRTPLDSRLIETAGEVPTILATACKDPSRCGVYQDKGCRVLTVPGADGRVGSSGAGEDAGQDGDRQHPPGRRRYLKLVCSEVGDCAEGFLLHGAKAFRRCKGKDTCGGQWMR